jgi:hypothetical protein
MKWIQYEISSRINNFTTGLRNLWKWKKIIWQDRDWDYFFTYQILKKKLEFQRDHFEQNGWHDKSDNDVKTLNECIELINKVQHEVYIDEAINLESDWTEKVLIEAENKHNEARKELFEKLEKNIEHWWD